MRSIAHHDNGQQPKHMKFLRIIFGCPEGAREWRIVYFAMLLHSKNAPPMLNFEYYHMIPLLCDDLEGEVSIDNHRYILNGRQVFVIPPYTVHSNIVRRGRGIM